MPITHTDGAEYFSKTEIESIIKDRVKNVEQTAAAWERKATEAEAKAAQAQSLAAEIDTWKGKAAEASGALNRYQAAASVGITDPDTIWLLEQAHQRAMSAVEEGKRTDFAGYLTTAKTDPSVLPAGLRGAFAGAAAQAAAQTTAQTTVAAQQGATQTQAPSGQAAAGNAAQTGATGQQVGQQGARPAWAPAVTGQTPVPPPVKQSFADRVKAATTLDDIQKLHAERRNPVQG